MVCYKKMDLILKYVSSYKHLNLHPDGTDIFPSRVVGMVGSE
jgi:hypothetical protein